MKKLARSKPVASAWGIWCAVACLIALAIFLQSCGGSSQPPARLTITTATLPNGTAEVAYSEPVQASGGAGPYRWGVSSGTLPHNLELKPSNTNTAMISGTPDTPVQADPFSMRVTDSANQSATQPYHVSVLGVADTLTLTPASLNFNPRLVGSASGAETMTLSNSGSTPVAVNSVVAAGTNATDFSQTNTCASGLAPGASCTITVTFTPSQVGPRVASVTINDDTVGTPHTLGLNGIGLSSGANATLSASDLTFSSQVVNTTSAAQTLTLSNYGTATLNIARIAATGEFAENSACVATLASAASCSISVTFTPTGTGTLNGTLSFTDNTSGTPQTVMLSGTGVQPACVPPGGRCSKRGTCCPVSPPFHDICGGQGICIVE